MHFVVVSADYFTAYAKASLEQSKPAGIFHQQ